ncbi:cytochrome P450 [Nemania sp. FL0916]|nr:cytochrome P450 [Nemania sp. FL0916]
MLLYILFGSLAFAATAAVWVWPKLYPTPYPGIPYNKESAKRIIGDIPIIAPIVQATNVRSGAVFAASTQRLGTPIAQLLFPAIRKPLIVLEDPREVEDILVRRQREFDKAPFAVDIMAPMFPNGTISQYTTPKLRAQKRLWADVMSTEFLRKTAAPNIYKSTCSLVELWRLKSSTVYPNQSFNVREDFQNTALDVIWAVLVGEESGIMRYELNKLQHQYSGTKQVDSALPYGHFLKEEVEYISKTITRNSNSPFPKWAQKMATYTSRYRKFRRTIITEIGLIMSKAVDRFQRIEAGKLEADESDTCMMDLVLRRQILEAKKAGRPLINPAKDHNITDEIFVLLVGGHDSTSNALAWFVKFMEAFPTVQNELRRSLKDSFQDQMPSAEDILETNIPYLDATCEESFRLAGLTEGNVRQALVDTEILGCRIPKGAEIFLRYNIDRPPAPVDISKRSASSQAAINKHGCDVFQTNAGRDLQIFEPKRWLVRNDVTKKDTFNAYALPSLGFGGGYRGCAGRRLAYMEFRIVITLLILNFEFLELPQEYKVMSASETLFRQPDMPYVRLRIL